MQEPQWNSIVFILIFGACNKKCTKYKYVATLFFFNLIFPSPSTGTSCVDCAKRKLGENGTDSPKKIKQSDNGIPTI